MSADHEWLRNKIRDILAVTSRGHSRERFLEVETLVSQMRDHLDRASAAAQHLVAAVPDAVAAERAAIAKIADEYARNDWRVQDLPGAIRARSAAPLPPKGSEI